MATHVDRKREPGKLGVVSDAVVDSKGGDNDVGDNTGEGKTFVYTSWLAKRQVSVVQGRDKNSAGGKARDYSCSSSLPQPMPPFLPVGPIWHTIEAPLLCELDHQ